MITGKQILAGAGVAILVTGGILAYQFSRLMKYTLKIKGIDKLSASMSRVSFDAYLDFVNNSDLQIALGRMNDILLECRPKRTKVFCFDTGIYNEVEYESSEYPITDYKPKGGGGTSFTWLDNIHECDLCIVLTDLEGTFPSFEPSFPVVWLSTTKHIAPFGETIRVDRI